MTAGLTRQQSAALAYIKAYIAEHDVSPSYDEIASSLGVKSKSFIAALVDALEERGHIQRLPGRARSIVLADRASIPAADAAFHLRRILDAIRLTGFIAKNDPIVQAASDAMGDTPP